MRSKSMSGPDNYIYQYRIPFDNFKSAIAPENTFISIIERIEKVDYDLSGNSVPDNFGNGFLRARLFNNNYDITVTLDDNGRIMASILTEQSLSITDMASYIILDSYEISNFIQKKELKAKKYICKLKEDDSANVNESVSFVNEKQVFYRLMGVK